MEEEEEKVKRYYLGVDWADEFHQVWVSDPEGKKVTEMKVDGECRRAGRVWPLAP